MWNHRFEPPRRYAPPLLIQGGENSTTGIGALYQAQRRLGPPELVLDRTRRRIRCGGTVIALTPINFAFLAWFARRAQEEKGGICRNRIDPAETADYLAEYRALHDELSGEYERVCKAVGETMDAKYFDERKAPLHRQLLKALGKAGAQPYLITSDERRPCSRYFLKLKPEQIRFADLDTEGNKP